MQQDMRILRGQKLKIAEEIIHKESDEMETQDC